MKKPNPIVILTGAALLLVIFIFHLYFFREMVILAYYGSAPEWINKIIHLLYPRFEVEKHRFPLTFFLSKSDQILLRLLIISGIVLTGYYVLKRKKKLGEKFYDLWSQETSTFNTNILRILYFSFLIIIFHDIYQDMMRMENASIFYRPIILYKILNIPFPSESGILVLCLFFFISCLLALLNIFPIWNSVIAVLTFIIIQGFVFSFEKYDHGFATFTYAGLILPFLLYEKRIAEKKRVYVQNAWPLTLIMVTICLCYFYTGMEKLLISHIDWFTGDSLRSHLLAHDIPSGKILAEKKFWVGVLANITLIIQIGFISILFKENLKYIFIPAAFLFHLSVSIFLGVGGILNPWILVYIFFFDWSWLKRKG